MEGRETGLGFGSRCRLEVGLGLGLAGDIYSEYEDRRVEGHRTGDNSIEDGLVVAESVDNNVAGDWQGSANSVNDNEETVS